MMWKPTGNHVWWHAIKDYGWSVREKRENSVGMVQQVNALLFHGPMDGDGMVIPEKWVNQSRYPLHSCWPVTDPTDPLWAEMEEDVLDWATGFVLSPMDMLNIKMKEQ